MRPLAKAGHVTSRITGPISNLARYATSGAAGLFIGEQFDHAILSIEHLTGSHAVTTATEIPTTVVVSHPTSEGVVHPIAAVETHTALPTVTHDHPHNPLLGNVDVDHGKQTVVPTTTSTETPVPSPTHEPTPTIRPTLVQATATVVAPTPEAHVTIPVPHSSDADDRINQQPVAGGTVPVVPAPLAPQQPDNHPSQFHYDSTPLHGQTTANGDKYFGGYGNPAHLAMVQKAGTTEQIPLHVDKEYEEQINRALAAEGKVAHFHTAALNNTLNDATHRYTENHGFTDDFKQAHNQAERNILNAESRMILSGNDVKHFSHDQLIHDAETLGIVTDVHGTNQASTPLDTSRFDHQVTPIGKLNGTYLEPHHDLTTTREQHTLIMHQEVTGAEKLAQLMTEEGTHGYTIDKSHYEARLQQALHIQTGEGFASIIKRDPQHAQEYRDLQQLYLFSDDAKSVRDHLNNHTTIEAAQRLGVLAHVPAGFGYHYGTHGNDGVATPLTHLSFDGGIAKGNPFDVHNPLEIIYSDGHTQAWHPEVVGTGNIFNLLTRSKLEGYQINTTNLMYYFNLAANYREQGILTEKEHADFVHIWNLCTSQRQLDATHAKMLLDILQKLQVINPKNN